MYTDLVRRCGRCGLVYGCILDKIHVECVTCTHKTECKFICTDSISGGYCRDCFQIGRNRINVVSKSVYGC